MRNRLRLVTFGNLFITHTFAAAALIAAPVVNAQDPFDVNQKIHHLDLQGEIVDVSSVFPDYQERCFLHGASSGSTLPESRRPLLESVAREPYIGSFLLNQEHKYNPLVCFETREDGTHGYYDYESNLLVIHDTNDLPEQVAAFVHELRHLEQVGKNFEIDLSFDISEMARLRFAVEADAHAIAVLFAWQSRLNGNDSIWAAMLQDPLHGDIAEAFEDEIFSSGDRNAALLSAFRQWYVSPKRTEAYHLSSNTDYLDLLDSSKLIRQYGKLPAAYFDALCTLPDGGNYGCHESAEIEKFPELPRYAPIQSEQIEVAVDLADASADASVNKEIAYELTGYVSEKLDPTFADALEISSFDDLAERADVGAPVLATDAYVDKGSWRDVGTSTILGHNPYDSFLKRMEDSQSKKFTIEVNREENVIVLKGEFDAGVVSELESVVKANPDTIGIVLESIGGSVYQARGLARIIQNKSLHTYVFNNCYSACTIAFIAGSQRFLGEHAELGFHAYQLDRVNSGPAVNLLEEQEKDELLFDAQIPDKSFVNNIFRIVSPDLWIPPQVRLQQAGVAHAIVPVF